MNDVYYLHIFLLAYNDRELSNVKLLSDPVMCMDVSPDQRHVVTGGAGASMRRAKLVLTASRSVTAEGTTTAPADSEPESSSSSASCPSKGASAMNKKPTATSGIGALFVGAERNDCDRLDDGTRRSNTGLLYPATAAVTAATLNDCDGVVIPTVGENSAH
jgi:hypothetical protein